jgi:hypothetical protein
MRGEYEIRPQADGKTWLLRRFAKDGSVYDPTVLTKSYERNGEIVYADANGRKYTTLPDGRLEEKVVFDSAPAVPRTPEPKARDAVPHRFVLMATPPVVPRQMGSGPIPMSNLTLPKGEEPLRSEADLLLLTTGKDDYGARHEVVVQKVSSNWYIRTSIDDPGVAPAFRIEEDGSVSGYRDLPPGVPQVAFAAPGSDGPVGVRPLPAETAPAPSSMPDGTTVEYQRHGGVIIARSDAAGRRFYLTLEGEPEIELESVRGSQTWFTPVGRGDINIIVDRQGRITVRDMGGRDVSLPDLIALVRAVPSRISATASAPARPTLARTAAVVPLSPSAPAPYPGPSSGKLECDGQPIPQNGERVFSDLPPVNLRLVYDTNTWEGVLVPNGQTQRLILRNKKPGTQKKCTVQWSVAP